MINNITSNALELGLKVNGGKTQMICVNSIRQSETKTFIRDAQNGGKKIVAGNELKILGFYFGENPTVENHIDKLKTKFRKRLWILRNLRRAGTPQKDLLDAYTCFIRPTLDYCANVYHSMLTGNQAEQLEKMQLSALKIIYGFHLSKDELNNKAGITTLHERRENLFVGFCKKAYGNERFKTEWFQERTFEGPNLRVQKILKEKHAKSSRLFNSPLYKMRRTLNDVLVS